MSKPTVADRYCKVEDADLAFAIAVLRGRRGPSAARVADWLAALLESRSRSEAR